MIGYDALNNTLTFTPKHDLAYDATYIATVTTKLKDVKGYHLGTPYSWQFHTIPKSELKPERSIIDKIMEFHNIWIWFICAVACVIIAICLYTVKTKRKALGRERKVMSKRFPVYEPEEKLIPTYHVKRKIKKPREKVEADMLLLLAKKECLEK